MLEPEHRWLQGLLWGARSWLWRHQLTSTTTVIFVFQSPKCRTPKSSVPSFSGFHVILVLLVLSIINFCKHGLKYWEAQRHKFWDLVRASQAPPRCTSFVKGLATTDGPLKERAHSETFGENFCPPQHLAMCIRSESYCIILYYWPFMNWTMGFEMNLHVSIIPCHQSHQS